jgi:hypothetical protein
MIEPNKDNKAGNNLINNGKENSASTIDILLGFIYKELPIKSEPTPTNKSENI